MSDPIASAEVRYGGWSYRAETYDEWVGTYGGSARRTSYFRCDGGWRPVAWDSIPRPVYRNLRAMLKDNLQHGEVRDDPSTPDDFDFYLWQNAWTGTVWLVRVSDNRSMRSFPSSQDAFAWGETRGVRIDPHVRSRGARIAESDTNQDWHDRSPEELLDYVTEMTPYLGGLSDAHTRLNLSPDQFAWRFRELPTKDLLRIMSEVDWRRWYDGERRTRRGEDGDDNYFDSLEQEWNDGNVGPIIVVTIDRSMDIADGWHRAAIAVTQRWKTVPAVVGVLGSRR